jgi:anthranilate 1,2-dioxygenase (deaminating, decarboxylating) large subunit
MPASESFVSTRRDAAQWKAFVGGCIDFCSAEGVYWIAREMFAEPKLFERETELIFEKLCL